MDRASPREALGIEADGPRIRTGSGLWPLARGFASPCPKASWCTDAMGSPPAAPVQPPSFVLAPPNAAVKTERPGQERSDTAHHHITTSAHQHISTSALIRYLSLY